MTQKLSKMAHFYFQQNSHNKINPLHVVFEYDNLYLKKQVRFKKPRIEYVRMSRYYAVKDRREYAIDFFSHVVLLSFC